jgi:hypothetical protein
VLSLGDRLSNAGSARGAAREERIFLRW